MPRDHQSAAWLYGPPVKTSGAVHTKTEKRLKKININQKMKRGKHKYTNCSTVETKYVQIASQVHRVYNWVSRVQREQNAGGALMSL